MKVIKQYIVKTTFGFQIVFYCEGERFFQTTNGGFGQRDMSIKEITGEEAQQLIDKSKT